MPNITDFGNGVGFLYITDLDNNILSNVPNDKHGVETVKRDGLTRGPIAANINAFGSVEITSAAADNTTGLTINGVAQISGSVANSVGDEEQTAQDIAAAVNSHIAASGGDYRAVAIGAKILLIAPVSLGGSVNGHVVAIAFDGATTSTNIDVAGGNDGSESPSTINGHRYYINAAVAAVPGTIAGATEITVDLVARMLQSRLDAETNTIASGVISPTRTMSMMYIDVDTEGGGGTDDLDSIDVGDYVLGDIIIISGVDSTRVTTLQDLSTTGGNIKLSSETDFTTGDRDAVITLRLVESSVNGTVWNELYRAPAVALDANTFRTAGLPIEAGTQELDIDSFGLPHLETLVAAIPVGPSWTNVIHTGAPLTLGADFELALPAVGTAIDGQKFTCKYSATGVTTSGAGDVIIFGVTLNELESLNGGVVFEAVLNDDATAWTVTKYYDFQLAQVDEAQIADDAISTVKIQDDAVTTVKILNDAVTTDKILNDNVTEPKIVDGAITVDKLSAQNKKEVIVIPLSFEAGELGEYQVPMPYKCDVIELCTRVNLLIEATDIATIQLANNSGSMADGLATHSAGAVFGDSQCVNPTTNTEILAGEPIKLTTAKTTAGGKVIAIIHVQRKS